MSNRFLDLCTPGIAGLKPYIPGKPVSELERELGITNSIKLASNENPLGPPDSVKKILAGEIDDLSLYPDGSGYRLRNKLAKMHGASAAGITLGNGSNDVLDMIARVFLGADSEAVFSQYAFAVYPIVTQAVGATARAIPAVDYGHDLEAMLSAINDKTRVVFIANPNNPTGTWLRSDELRRFVEAVSKDVIIVIDEAYFEYVDETDYPDTSSWVSEFDNLIVTRTFSKAYGIAGLRVGYSLSHPDVADLLNRVRQPFNVNSMSLVAAETALDDKDYLARAVELNRQGMQQYIDAFTEMGLEWIPSVGNFISVNLARDASQVDKRLLQEGVITRPVANYGMPQYLRISIGLPEENTRCIASLKKVLTIG
jgi:histidinol-phosphate aminotransferase